MNNGKEIARIDKVDELQPAPLNGNLVEDVKAIIEQGRRQAYASVNAAMIETYWNVGRRIVEEEQHGQKRAEYGSQMIEFLAQQLAADYGNSYSPRYLRSFRKFYTVFPDYEIWKSRFPNLMWTHIFRALRVGDETAIRWYLSEASTQMWTVKMLDRLLPEGTLLTETRKGQKDIVYKSTAKERFDKPMLAMINGGSASGAEAFAGAISERAGAKLVGETSYGKGIVQAMFRLPDKRGGVKLTTGEYLLPNGTHIHEKGLKPDVEIPFTGEKTDYGTEKDNQLSKAIEIISLS